MDSMGVGAFIVFPRLISSTVRRVRFLSVVECPFYFRMLAFSQQSLERPLKAGTSHWPGLR